MPDINEAVIRSEIARLTKRRDQLQESLTMARLEILRALERRMR